MEVRDNTRILIVANKSVATPALVDTVRRRVEAGPCTLALLIPDACNPATAAWTLRRARRLLSKTDDPYAGIATALQTGDYDEILLSTLPEGGSRWLRDDLPARVQALGTPVTVVVASPVSA